MTQHGNFSVHIKDSTIHVSSRGSFNVEGTLKCCEAIDNAIAQLSPSPFLICVDLTKFEGATPEAWDVTERFNESLINRPLTAKAIVANSRFVTSYVESVNKSAIRHKIKVFDDPEAANSWLINHLT